MIYRRAPRRRKSPLTFLLSNVRFLARYGTYGFVISMLLACNATANSSVVDPTSLASLIQFALDHSLDPGAARSESKYQEATETFANRSQKLPQIILAASYQRNYYSQLKTDGSGNLISNNGERPAFGLTVTYDLQKLLGADSELAHQAARLAKLQEKVAARNLVRGVKKGFYAIAEITSEIEELNRVITLFSKIDEILKKQRRIGVFNEIERKQFQVQKSILNSDLQSRTSDLEAAYNQLSLLMNVDVPDLKERVKRVTKLPELRFASRQSLTPDQTTIFKDEDVIDNLSGTYSLARMEYEKFNSLPLPTVYARAAREVPTMFSGDGPQNIAEVGVTFPIDAFFTRPAQKAQLAAKADKNDILFQRALLDYRNQIRLSILNLNRYKEQTALLRETRAETKSLLDKSFLFYSQKRLDVLGTLDIFQKYLQTARNALLNDLQIKVTDADLEYLIGGANL